MTEQVSARTLSRRRLLQLAALAGGASVLGVSGCATPTGLPGPGTYNVAMNRLLTSLDNKLLQFEAAVTLQRAVRQALVRLTPDLALENVLAERFELTKPNEWTVRLRSDIRYSDNSAVQIADVATALEKYRDTKGGFLATLFPEWPTVVRVDDRTFRLRTEEPQPVLDYLMANILITPAEANKAEDLESGVGTGPYVITDADRGTGAFVLDRNTNYWGTPVITPQVQVRFLAEESSRVVALRSGEIDVIDSVSPDAIEQLKGLPGVSIDSRPGTRLTHLFYNFRKPSSHPLSDARVREALSYAINGPALIDNILQRSVVQATGVVPPSLTGAAAVGQFRYDPAKAKQILDSLGVRNLPVKIIWESGEFTSDTQVMEAIYEMLAQVGCKPSLQQFESGGDISTWRQGRGGDWDVLANGYPGTTGLAITMMQGMYAGTAEKEKTRDTYHGYIFPKITGLISSASQEVDETRRAELVKQAQQEIWNTWPAMWAFAPNAVVARRDRVQGLVLGANNSYDLAGIRLEERA